MMIMFRKTFYICCLGEEIIAIFDINYLRKLSLNFQVE